MSTNPMIGNASVLSKNIIDYLKSVSNYVKLETKFTKLFKSFEEKKNNVASSKTRRYYGILIPSTFYHRSDVMIAV